MGERAMYLVTPVESFILALFIQMLITKAKYRAYMALWHTFQCPNSL